MDKSYQAAYRAAIQCLSRREFSGKELTEKLLQQGHAPELINDLLAALKAKDYQSDSRYCEMFVRTRMRQYYGPIKIAYELKQKGLSSHLINNELSKHDDDWLQLIAELIDKKQRSSKPIATDKLIKFLLTKGFDYSLIKQALSQNQ